jgi:Uma2 family endonuclease
MSTARRSSRLPPLVPGQRLKQPEFHRRYEAYPDDVKFELIGGVVYMTSPLRRPHGNYSFVLGTALGVYSSATPGTEGLDNTTTILGEESEPQPDLALRVLPAFGGRSHDTEDEYVKGPPELVAEIAHSSRDIDLHQKRDDYQRAGVVEYLVLSVAERELHWFHFPSGRPIRPKREGVRRSRIFPGLWIHGEALLARDSARLIEVVQQGLASRPHAAFVKRLQAAHRRLSRG